MNILAIDVKIILVINNNLRYCREELEMTQEKLGIVLGASKQTISNWEMGYIFIPLSKLVRFCNLYNYSLDFVVGFTKKNIKYDKDIKLNQKLIGNNLKTLRKTKTDKKDAYQITVYLMSIEYKPHPKQFYHKFALKSLCRLRTKLVKQRSYYDITLTNILDMTFSEFKPFLMVFQQQLYIF